MSPRTNDDGGTAPFETRRAPAVDGRFPFCLDAFPATPTFLRDAPADAGLALGFPLDFPLDFPLGAVARRPAETLPRPVLPRVRCISVSVDAMISSPAASYPGACKDEKFGRYPSLDTTNVARIGSMRAAAAKI